MDVPEPCNKKIFNDGKPLFAANTWYPEDNPIRATGFEEWIKEIRKKSKQDIDWHYSGGIAQVLYLGDKEKIIEAMNDNPCPAQIMHWFQEGDAGLYRAGVTQVPKDTIAAFYEGGGKSSYIVKDKEN
jgi:hypothetical protein